MKVYQKYGGNKMTNEIANVNQRELTDTILTRVNNMKQEGLTIPDNYSPANALNIAYLQLEESGMVKKVSPESLTKSLLTWLSKDCHRQKHNATLFLTVTL